MVRAPCIGRLLWFILPRIDIILIRPCWSTGRIHFHSEAIVLRTEYIGDARHIPSLKDSRHRTHSHCSSNLFPRKEIIISATIPCSRSCGLTWVRSPSFLKKIKTYCTILILPGVMIPPRRHHRMWEPLYIGPTLVHDNTHGCLHTIGTTKYT